MAPGLTSLISKKMFGNMSYLQKHEDFKVGDFLCAEEH